MVTYLTRTGTVTADPSSGAETELTANYDDSAPGRFTVPSGLSAIREIRVGVVVRADAADDAALVALRLRGAVGIVPTIVVAAGGIGNDGTPISSTMVSRTFVMRVSIALLQGKNLEVYAVMHGTANSDAEVAVTLVMA